MNIPRPASAPASLPNAGPQRIGIVGSGAIGGHFAARLARAGHTVSMLARGRTLEAIRQHGLRYTTHTTGQEYSVVVQASETAAELGPQDLIVIALKGQALPEVAPALSPLIGPQSTILTVGNGLPWWYFLAGGQPLDGLRLRCVDPTGSIEKALPLPQLLGASIFASCQCPAPGVVQHSSGARVLLGEPGGGLSSRASAWADLLASAGLGGEVSANIRRDLWIKLLGNACFNPVSLLTQASTDRMLADPNLQRLFIRLMEECIALGQSLGLALKIDPVQRIEQTRQLGAIKTSMLQDLEASRNVELDAILGTVLECATAMKHPMPQLDSLYALARMRARQAGLYTNP